MEQNHHLFAHQEQCQVPPFHPGNRRIGASPRTSDSSHMEERPRPMEPSMNDVGNVNCVTAIGGAGNFDRLGDCQSVNASASSVNSGRNQAPFVLLDWYESRDGPWDPLVGKNTPSSRQEDSRSRAAHMPLKNNGAAFQGYRGSTVPSECDTMHTGVLPSDSGYGSGPRPSIGNPSVYDDVDRNTETQSLVDTFPSFQLNNGDMSWAQPAESHNISIPAGHDKSNRNLICTHCHQKVKTKSELNKHNQRHTKPFHCTFEGCSRADGFSTKNDLDRHIRSRHPRVNATGNRYVCRLGSCKTKEKIWPRADNFRQHLKRVHKKEVSPDDDLEQYLHKDPSACPPDLVGMGSSVAGFPMESNPEPHGLPSPGFLLDSRPVLSPFRPFGDPYGGDYMTNTLSYQAPANLGNDPQFTMMPPSHSPDDLREQSMDSIPPMDLIFDDPDNQEDLPEADCIHDTAPGGTYIQPNVLGHNSISAEKLGEEHTQLRSSEDRFSRNEDDKASMRPDQGFSNVVAHSEQVTAVGTAPDAAITVDDEDAPADELSPESPTSTSEFKPEVTEQKHDSLSQPEPASSASEPMDLDDKDKVAAMLQSLQEKGLLAELGYQKTVKPPTTKSKKITAPPAPAQETNNNIVCSAPGCNKSFARRCELKKHMKRHDKPYGCTYPSCSKKFGSKNDWKRHENSQHFQLEVWKCNERVKDNPDGFCGKVCHRRETFKYHLQRDHGIQALSTIEQKWEACRVGRNCETRFWCGFCRKIIDINQKGLEAWTERFDHIDDHFAGRNGEKMMISQWKAVDPDLPEIDFSTPRSDEESESSSPKATTPATAQRSLGFPKEGPGSSKKRKSSADHQSSKMRRTETNDAEQDYFWYCCKCNQPAGNIAFTAACMENDCEQHPRCRDCRVERIEHVG